ncbi:hypothetical protein [Vagococcus fessus]|uniref:Uncharacterized protein n=1 Tax=Vagococcus fessus TaxID=120370 RepID=A0A430A8H7_9ENTE|nr:hypothetical protein [Vagococcus fessus]RSU03423.1 hypothetical protein CBF31_06845 [Vagococcus fessus]
MTVSNIFKEYVAEGNSIVIRVSLVELLKNDLTHKMFEEYCQYLEEHNFSIYEEHDGELYDDIDYTTDYLTSQLNQLVRNFSKERVRCIKVIQSKLYGETLLKQRQAEIEYNNINRKKIAGSLFIAGGSLLAVGATIFSGSIGLVVLGALMVAGGVILLVRNKES